MNNITPAIDAVEAQPYEDVLHKTPILVEYWQAMLRHRIAIAIIVAICIVLGIVATLLMTPYYTSTATVEINREQDKVTNVEGLRATDGGAQALEFYQTQYSLLESRSLAERVARSLNLGTNDEFFDILEVSTDNLGAQSAAQRSERLKLATNLLQGHISIEPIRGSSLVDISFSSPSPKLSAQVANTVYPTFFSGIQPIASCISANATGPISNMRISLPPSMITPAAKDVSAASVSNCQGRGHD